MGGLGGGVVGFAGLDGPMPTSMAFDRRLPGVASSIPTGAAFGEMTPPHWQQPRTVVRGRSRSRDIDGAVREGSGSRLDDRDDTEGCGRRDEVESGDLAVDRPARALIVRATSPRGGDHDRRSQATDHDHHEPGILRRGGRSPESTPATARTSRRPLRGPESPRRPGRLPRDPTTLMLVGPTRTGSSQSAPLPGGTPGRAFRPRSGFDLGSGGAVAHQGKNDFGKFGYGGPCPPRGTHRYFFRLYVLDTSLLPSAGETKERLLVP